MIFIPFLILSSILILIILTRSYKKELLSNLDKKKHSLYFLYPSCFYISDFLSKNNIPLFSKTKKNISLLYPKHEEIFMSYIVFSKRLSIAILTLIIFLLLGIANEILAKDNTILKSLQRPTDGNSNKNYTLIVNNEDECNEISLKIKKKIYTQGEAIKIFTKYHDEIIKTLIDKNPSVDKISLPLNFVPTIGNEVISLSFFPEDENLIDFSGSLIYKNIPKEGINTGINVTMSLDNTEVNLYIGLTLFPKEESKVSIIQKEVESFINNDSNKNLSNPQLPSKTSQGNVTFFSSAEKSSINFFVIGFIFSILLYFLSSKELDKKVKDRNFQMLSDYSEIVSKLLIFYNSGFTIKSAFKKIYDDYSLNTNKKRYAYEEIKITLNSLSGGMSESIAYSDFGKRCSLFPYIKLGALLEQSLLKGSSSLKKELLSEVHNAFENKKSLILSNQEKSSTKMLIPLTILLLLILLLITVPAFISMSL